MIGSNQECGKSDSTIKKVKVTDASFEKSTENILVPTHINFIYGNNGAGKSTIGNTIVEKEPELYDDDIGDYEMLIYNEEFVSDTIVSAIDPAKPDKDIPGIFSLGKENKEIEEKLKEKATSKIELKKKGKKINDDIEKNKNETEKLVSHFQDICWSKTSDLRTKYSDALTGKKKKKEFADAILLETEPSNINLDELSKKYTTAYNSNAPLYKELDIINPNVTDDSPLLAEKIINSNNSEFSIFMDNLKATDWVYEGHKKYHDAANGKCPYCQQKLPENFENEISKCFDKNYQDKLDALNTFKTTYIAKTDEVIEELTPNLQNAYLLNNEDLKKQYENLISELQKSIKLNISTIDDKIQHPNVSVSLESLQPTTLKLITLINQINTMIKNNNNVVNNQKNSQAECQKEIIQYFAYTLKVDIDAYKKDNADLKKNADDLTKQLTDMRTAYKTLDTEEKELRNKVVNVTDAIDRINTLLLTSGFQGFTIREKETKPNYYEIVRSNGDIAKKLSEGERNFIAFLYFYQLILGNTNEDENPKDKIVVIDDPVSSMDSSALFIISSLVREIISRCPANYRYKDDNKSNVKQVFVLTHNAFFHHNVTHDYDLQEHYKYVSFFEVKKHNEISSINICLEDGEGELKHNKNPLRNYYSSLWDTYKEVDSSNTLITVMRQILNYYFIQMCGYKDDYVERTILDENSDKFVTGTDSTELQLVRTIINFVNSPVDAIQDDLNFTSTSIDVDVCKEIFHKIFQVLGQSQHYDMMMKRK